MTLDHIQRNPQILTFNLGNHKGTSVQLINTFEKLIKLKSHLVLWKKAGDNAFVVADNSLAKSILNWTPNRKISDMCRDGWNWQLKNPNGY